MKGKKRKTRGKEDEIKMRQSPQSGAQAIAFPMKAALLGAAEKADIPAAIDAVCGIEDLGDQIGCNFKHIA